MYLEEGFDSKQKLISVDPRTEALRNTSNFVGIMKSTERRLGLMHLIHKDEDPDLLQDIAALPCPRVELSGPESVPTVVKEDNGKKLPDEFVR